MAFQTTLLPCRHISFRIVIMKNVELGVHLLSIQPNSNMYQDVKLTYPDFMKYPFAPHLFYK